MIKAILAAIAAIAAAIPTLWLWKKHRVKKKAKRALEKDLEKIAKAVGSGDTDAVVDQLKHGLRGH